MGYTAPEPLVPGKRYRISMQMNDAAHRFAVGNRIRLALSTAYWPIVWPSPVAPTIALDPSFSRMHAGAAFFLACDASLRTFDPAEGATPAPIFGGPSRSSYPSIDR